MIRFIYFFLTFCLLTISYNANADVIFKDKSGQADHTVIFKADGSKVFLFQCPPNESTEGCVPMGKQSGYSLAATLSTAKKSFREANTVLALEWVCLILGVLLAGGFTLVAAAEAITVLAAGAFATALVTGLAAFLAGGNLYIMAEHIPSAQVEAKQALARNEILKNGVMSTPSHIITVPDLKKFEDYLITVLPK